jgi:phage gp36-like protein
MAYVTETQLTTAIPAQHLIDALDDDRDGTADTGKLTEVIAQGSQQVDALLESRYAVPFDPVPKKVAEAAFVFVCELLYQRRGLFSKDNPWFDRAERWREALEKIGNGEGQISTDEEQAYTPGAAVTEDAAVNDTMR